VAVVVRGGVVEVVVVAVAVAVVVGYLRDLPEVLLGTKAAALSRGRVSWGSAGRFSSRESKKGERMRGGSDARVVGESTVALRKSVRGTAGTPRAA